jgi:ATP-dependent Clp protease ATP-binding subunit ClpC
MTQIVKLMLGQVRSKVEAQGFKIEFTPESEKFLVKNGFDTNSGARPLHRTIQRMVEDVLAEDILRKKFKAGATIYVEVDSSGEKLLFSNERSAQV